MSDEIMVLAGKHDTKIFSQKATLTRLRSTADRGASGGAARTCCVATLSLYRYNVSVSSLRTFKLLAVSLAPPKARKVSKSFQSATQKPQNKRFKGEPADGFEPTTC